VRSPRAWASHYGRRQQLLDSPVQMLSLHECIEQHVVHPLVKATADSGESVVVGSSRVREEQQFERSRNSNEAGVAHRIR
jgi:hypothetical protein